MDTKETLEQNCDTAQHLQAYLRRKGENHNCYKCYSSLKRIVEIRDTKTLYLSNGERWNDISDRENFNSALSKVENFGRCFSFSQDESVAMWMLYGGIHKLSGMIDFTKKGIQSILGITSVNVGYFDTDKAFKIVRTLERKDFDIYITDVIYYKKTGSQYFVNRSDESCHNLNEAVFKSLMGCKKSYPWKYENECRLIVSIPKQLITQDCTSLQIDLKDLDLGKSLKRIYRGPNYPLDDVKNSLPSKLDNTIDWSLCDGNDCINRNRRT